MMITLKKDANKQQVDAIMKKIRELGFAAHTNHGKAMTVIGVVGENAVRTKDIFDAMEGVEVVTPISKPYKLVSREFKKENTVIELPNGLQIGGPQVVIMAGPCSVDTKERLMFTAEAVKAAGAQVLRGGAFKPRTSPYAFQGHGEKALRFLADARKAHRTAGDHRSDECQRRQIGGRIRRYHPGGRAQCAEFRSLESRRQG
jgi:3-deoxy-7-phosphoheptulonate synthase